MDNYQQTINSWDESAEVYQEKFMDIDIYNESYDFFHELINNKNAAILDVGCGPGNITKYLLSKSPGYKITGIDAAPSMVKLAAQNNPSASFLQMDCRNLLTLNSNYDAVVCGFCIPYLAQDDCKKLFADVNSILKPGGIFYASFIEGNPAHSGLRTGSNGREFYLYLHESGMVEALMIENQFKLMKYFAIDYINSGKQKEQHRIYIARKS